MDAGGEARALLRGPSIRRTAVRLLLEHPDHPEALHYREWYELLTGAGFAVAGKQPLAVFLTQLGRSPIVRRGTQSGVYALDRGAARGLRAQLEELQRRLGQLTASGSGPTTDLRAIRSRRTALTLEIGKLEKALEEAEELLCGPAAQAQPLSATGG